jgi:hypothetical protein
LLFRCDGQDYDSDEMIAPQIHDAHIITVFITKDFKSVFGAIMHHEKGLVMSRISGVALRLLAERTQNAELKKALWLETANEKSSMTGG